MHRENLNPKKKKKIEILDLREEATQAGNEQKGALPTVLY